MLTRSLLPVALLAASALTACTGSGGSDGSGAPDAGSAAASSSAGSASSPSPTGGGACTYTSDGSSDAVALPPSTPAQHGEVPVTIASSVGDLELTLDADRAPCTVNSFVSLAKQGYFAGQYCHRIGDPGAFPMLQCGDPTATDPNHLAMAGRGGPGYRFPDELTGSETYPSGTLAMANAGPDTNGSQFFMVFGDIGLSPDYTVFGRIDPATVKTLRKVAAAGNEGNNGDGTGYPIEPVRFTGVTVG